MNHKDEDLQEQFDRGDFSGEEIDAQAYQKVFDALKHEPEYKLPVYFADRLVTLIESREREKEVSHDNFWLIIGLLSFVVAFVVAFTLTDFKLSAGAFQFLAGYPGLVLFGIAFILLLNWLDRKIIRKVEAF
jgi:flagellar biogenesis protein FliO